MNLIQNTILNSLPANKKKTPSGWISFNAPCCIYNGETQDKKKRGGIMAGADGTISYHCFNCGYKASYVIGRKLTQKMRTFMGYIGIADDTIKKLAIEAMRYEEGDIKYEKKKFVNFHKKQMPKNTHSLDVWLEKYVAKDLTAPQYNKIDNLLNYLKVRGIDPTWYDFMYSPDMYFNFNERLIIPFYWRGDIVGYTGRLFEDIEKVKYVTDVQPGYVFNMDTQDWTRKFVIVTEGPFDAITISGVSILGSEINDVQQELINNLNRQVIVVPDRDAPGEKLINQAIEFGWSVAFPEWDNNVLDVADAVKKYGRLFTIQSILKSTESSKLKIDLKRKMYG
jgi:5S rRNA maturation endonuclease (ribonuclease M5)